MGPIAVVEIGSEEVLLGIGNDKTRLRLVIHLDVSSALLSRCPRQTAVYGVWSARRHLDGIRSAPEGFYRWRPYSLPAIRCHFSRSRFHRPIARI
jgi:hypothetical protein